MVLESHTQSPGTDQKVAHTLKRHLERIIAYAKYRMTNNYVEGMNNNIKAIVHKACGFCTTRFFKNAILFHCGKLNYSNLLTQIGYDLKNINIFHGFSMKVQLFRNILDDLLNIHILSYPYKINVLTIFAMVLFISAF